MHELNVAQFLANCLIILLSAKIFGEIAERFHQPAVLGELLGGIVLGLGLITFFRPTDPVLSLMAEFGVVLLLFETGLESDLRQLLKVGPISLAVACVGVALPFVAGYGVMLWLGYSGMKAILIGAALTATSVGITARVLQELGKLSSQEAQIILGAAVIDDIIGVIILSVVQGMAGGAALSWSAAARTAFWAIAFLGIALAIGPSISRYFVAWTERMRGRGALIIFAVCFAFAMALLAHQAGTALIVGAFAAGILLAQTEKRVQIRANLTPIADVFVPIFFVMVGARVDLSHYNPLVGENHGLIGLAAVLIFIAIFTKVVSGWAVWKPGIQRWPIGVGMIPRGEVGLIFAQIGLTSGVIDQALYAALVGMVVVTTLVTPPLLKKAFK